MPVTPESPSTEESGLVATANKRVAKVYDRYAPVYDWIYGRMLEPGRRALCERVNLSRPARVLEIGVGTGLTLDRYAVDRQVVGIDLSRAMLARAQARLASSGEKHRTSAHVGLAQMDAQSLALQDASFDCIVLAYVLSTVPDPQRLLREVLRVAVPNARIYVLNHFAGAGAWRWAEELIEPFSARLGFRSDLSMEAAFEGVGVEILSVQPVNLFGLSRLIELEFK